MAPYLAKDIKLVGFPPSSLFVHPTTLLQTIKRPRAAFPVFFLSAKMRSAIAVAAFAALAQAQDLDWDVVLQATPIPDVTIPVVYATAQSSTATATTVSYSSEAAIASVTSALAADPSDSFPLDSALAKRATTTSCAVQPTGAGPSVSPDNASNFLSYSVFSSAASAAPTPSGYKNTFTNLQASNK